VQIARVAESRPCGLLGYERQPGPFPDRGSRGTTKARCACTAHHDVAPTVRSAQKRCGGCLSSTGQRHWPSRSCISRVPTVFDGFSIGALPSARTLRLGDARGNAQHDWTLAGARPVLCCPALEGMTCLPSFANHQASSRTSCSDWPRFASAAGFACFDCSPGCRGGEERR
jgi:hypothetical protein